MAWTTSLGLPVELTSLVVRFRFVRVGLAVDGEGRIEMAAGPGDMEGRSLRRAGVPTPRHRIVITASRGTLAATLREVWAYRELLGLLARRDISLRYRQSLVGVGWAILQPTITTIIFTVVFGRLARLPSDGVPYAIFAFCGLLPWNYFARCLADSSDSLVGSANLVTKVYFPRLILPLSRVIAGLIDLGISLVIAAGMMLWYRITPSQGVWLLPLFVLVTALSAFGVGLWLTALNVRYRDVKFIVPFLIQCWMYASPVAYSTALVPTRYQWLYGLNPMVGVIEGFRWALLGRAAPNAQMMFASVAIVTVILAGGIAYFRRMERTFADVI